ncbi:MAG: HAMP domain-containing histidine kinase [Actinomycetota bacterium]|nr:HAMP domain-containing histidine kinase [Actinomycetota bacterium]
MSERSELRRTVTRLAAQFTILILVLLALMGALLYSIVAAGSAESVSRTLTDATLIDSPADAPLGVFVAISSNNALTVSRNAPAGLPDTAAISRVLASHATERVTLEVAGRPYSVLTTFRNGRVVQAAIDQHEGPEELGRLVQALVIAGAAAAVLAAVCSVWMARRAMHPLVQSLALQRRFVADASHELRTPLTLLSTRAQLLRRKLAGAGPPAANTEVAAGVERIVEDARSLTGILDDLLVSADPRGAAEHAPVDLGTVADRAVDISGDEARSRQIRLERIGSPAPVTVLGSEISLQRVFTALISNALDHARTSTTVEVGSRGRDAVIRVIDDGPGFAPDELRGRAFERFASSRPSDGSVAVTRHYGLGLALVAEIAALHHGSVSIAPPPPGGGAVVAVVLPLAGDRKATDRPV